MPDSLETRLRILEDKEAIRELIAHYGPLADSGDSEGVAALWAEDGSYAVGGMAAANGRAAIAGLIDGETHRQLMRSGCAHLLGPVAIELDGDVAIARGHSVVFRYINAGFEVWRVSSNRWELERGSEGWLVRRRVNAPLDGSEAARALLSLS
jgi:ketosteroid isomerase-like protein